MSKLHFNFIDGVLSEALSIGATSMKSAGLEDLPEIVSPDVVAVIFDPGAHYGDREVAYITAHTAGSNTATITRARESTAARTHRSGTPWVHGLLASDLDNLGQEGGGGGRVFIQEDQPLTDLESYLWIQTLANGDLTFWIETGE